MGSRALPALRSVGARAISHFSAGFAQESAQNTYEAVTDLHPPRNPVASIGHFPNGAASLGGVVSDLIFKRLVFPRTSQVRSPVQTGSPQPPIDQIPPIFPHGGLEFEKEYPGKEAPMVHVSRDLVLLNAIQQPSSPAHVRFISEKFRAVGLKRTCRALGCPCPDFRQIGGDCGCGHSSTMHII